MVWVQGVGAPALAVLAVLSLLRCCCSSRGFARTVHVAHLKRSLSEADGLVARSRVETQEAAWLAVNVINDKTDGLFDELLPQTRLNYSIHTSWDSIQATALAAADIVRQPTTSMPARMVAPHVSRPPPQRRGAR